MKQKFLITLLSLGAFVGQARAASDFYVNDALVLCPPQIPPQVNATNFVNNNFFSINFTNLLVPQLYETASTRNFTNNGIMIANSGFRFDTAPPGSGVRGMAANFVNNGTINCGSALNTNNAFNLFYLFAGYPKMLISATNVSLRSSTNVVGVDGLFSLTGKNVDLNRAYVALEGFEDNPDSLFAAVDTVGLTAAYWGTGTNIMTPFFNFESSPPFTPGHLVSFPNGGLGFQQLVLPGATFYLNQYFRGTNLHVECVFLRNTNLSILNNVYFPSPGYSVVEWLGRQTNQINGIVTTNRLYLTDDFATFFTNVLTTNFSYYSASGSAIPINYTFTRFVPFLNGLGQPAPVTSPAGLFDFSLVTNQFAAFGAAFAPTTVNLTNLPPAGRYLTNLPGRLEISADQVLDLTMARITGLNYMGLKATNHVASTSGSKISVPYSDISLATTNGNLAITNLLYPSVQRFTGEVDLWTGRWTNGLGTLFTVLFVDSKLDPVAPSQVQDLTLRTSTNLVISDILNVTRTLLLDAENITLTTNQQPAATTRGEVNLISSAITWPGSTPRLKNLTNNGAITSANAIFFGGSRSSPFYTSNYNEPYLSFLNSGQVTTEGDLIWANYFENSGTFSTGLGFGSITLQSLWANLHDGAFYAPKGDITISGGSLTITNHVLLAGRGITLSLTNLLTDTGTTATNLWTARSFSVTAKPAAGDLLGTTITLTAPPSSESVNTWGSADLGCGIAGFSNNAAIGRLILNGGQDSLFTFAGAGTSNAIYVDYLELRNYATNRSGNSYIGLQINPNMKIHFAQAIANGVSIASKLDGANGGQLCWVSDYAGFYSGTNVVYPDGSTNYLNTAFVLAQDLDSDCDNIANGNDTTPAFLVTTAGLADATNGIPYLRGLTALGGPVGSVPTWSLAPGSAPLPTGLTLSAGGLLSGTPEGEGTNSFTVRASIETGCGIINADRTYTMVTQPGALVLSVAIEHHSPPGARVRWMTKPNAINYVLYRPSLTSGSWQVLTNFVSSAGGEVSIWDPVGTNKARYYRVQVYK